MSGTSLPLRQLAQDPQFTATTPYTNERGMDDDIGYGLLRIFPGAALEAVLPLQPDHRADLPRCCSSGAWPRRTCAWAAG